MVRPDNLRGEYEYVVHHGLITNTSHNAIPLFLRFCLELDVHTVKSGDCYYRDLSKGHPLNTASHLVGPFIYMSYKADFRHVTRKSHCVGLHG